MRVDPKVLVRRLTPTATKALEAAVGRASGSNHYEILVEHMLAALLSIEEGDAARILHNHNADRSRLLQRVEKNITKLRAGNSGKPTFSPTLFQWFEDAWVTASLEWGQTKLRTGALIAQLIAAPGRYTGETYEDLEAIDFNALKKDFFELIAPSRESQEVATESAGGGGGAPGGAPGGTGGDEALKRFCTNFTQKAREGKIDPVFGRDNEVRQMIDILVRRRKNNPIVVGEPGVGKTALIEGLANMIAQKQVPEVLQNVEIYGLDLGLLQAGAGVKGEFENRLKSVIAEVKASPKPIIMFIDEAHTIIGAGGTAGGSDAANLLKPALARGELRTIAATTWAEYKKYFEKDAALERRFQPVKVDEPSEHMAAVMLRGLRSVYEAAHGVPIRDEAIVAACKLSHRYISGRQLPDKAVDLLDTAAARVKMELATKPEELVALETQIESMNREFTSLSRDREDGLKIEPEQLEELSQKMAAAKDEAATIQAKWEAERTAVKALWDARKALAEAPADADKEALKKAVADATEGVAKVKGESPLVHADVDADVVARVIAGWTGIPVGKMTANSIASVLTLGEKLSNRVRGQDAATQTVAEIIRISTAGIRNPNTPIGVLLFVGPSGVGKTEMALTLADALYGGERFMTTINMSEFQEKHSVSKLVGSPPGYVGYGEGGVLTEAIRQRPYSVVLLDEVEKADLEVMNIFYQVFDKGTLADGEGRIIDCKNTVVILTSNLATDLVMKAYEGDETPSTEDVVNQIRPVLSKHFKPALLARMTIVPFRPINRPIMRQITEMRLNDLARRLRTAHKIETHLDPAMIDEIARRCTESETGARNVEHILRGSLVPAISTLLLERMAADDIPRKLDLGLTPSGDWRIDFS